MRGPCPGRGVCIPGKERGRGKWLERKREGEGNRRQGGWARLVSQGLPGVWGNRGSIGWFQPGKGGARGLFHTRCSGGGGGGLQCGLAGALLPTAQRSPRHSPNLIPTTVPGAEGHCPLPTEMAGWGLDGVRGVSEQRGLPRDSCGQLMARSGMIMAMVMGVTNVYGQVFSS